MLREFKIFLLRGSVLDLAVAVILGASFGAIVTSFVNDMLMPPIGLALGGVNFADMFVSLSGQSYPTLAAALAAPAAPTTKECPFCASPIPIKARRCPLCTSDFTKG